jgi:hypothetical protein
MPAHSAHSAPGRLCCAESRYVAPQNIPLNIRARTENSASGATILDAFQLPKDGRYYKRLIAGFERVFYSTFYFAGDEQGADAVVITSTSFRFVKDLRLWYFHSNETGNISEGVTRENVIVLSEEFWREIQEHPIPVDLNVVRALADSPGNLDLYVWLVWRCWTAKSRADIPLFGPEGLISQLGNSTNLRERDFRRQMVQWLKVIQQLWPECPAAISPTGASVILHAGRRPENSTAPAYHSE